MLDLREERKAGAKCAPGGGHDSTSVSQALDGMIDNFRTEKYGFTVKDVYSDDDSLKSRYEAITSKIKLVNSQLIKQIRDIKTYNVGGKYAGLSAGKLDRKNLHKYKTDKNIFYQNTYKQKECDLAFGIILDASGSMSGRGIEDGKVTMIVLHETLKALGINHSIIDHTCYGKRYTSDLRRYQCFREDKGYRLRKNYALAGITAESGNCDSGALWFMEKALLRTKNRDKICLIFSDGAPTECSGADLVAQVKHMEHMGIKVIGIGINFSSISKYYTDYANGKNLKEMLDIVADILKEYVIAKKD
jgi:nitric oxide reductase activation protein